MSRCFPFPPPGYEKKSRAADLDLLLKEKHKERKHKKEKKDKDKSESKEKREKDGNKEKHRDKDQKERHKEKKRDKDRGKDKQKTADEQRTVERIVDDAPRKLVESNHAAEEKRFKDEFTRRIIGNGKNAENQRVEDITNMDPRRVGGTLTERAKDTVVRDYKGRNGERKANDTPEKIVERNHAVGDKRFSDEFSRRIRADGKTAENRLVENFNSMDPRGVEGTFTDRAKDTEVRGKSKDRAIESWLEGTDRLKGVEVKGKHKDGPTEGICKPREDHVKDKSRERLLEGIDRTKEASMGKDKKKERRLQDIDRPNENIEGKEKNKEGEDKKKERLKDGCPDPNEKIIKLKDKIKDTVKEKKKMKLKVGIDQKPGESGNILLPGTSSVAAAFRAKGGAGSPSVDPNARKRKELYMNGALHDELRPAKLPKPASGSSLQLKNGFRSETVRIGIQSDKRKVERFVDGNTSLASLHNKEQKLNGKIEHQLPASNPIPTGLVADSSASLTSYNKEQKLNGKIEHRLPESKPKPSGAVVDITVVSPSLYGKVHKANCTPENRPPTSNLKSLASDTLGAGMTSTEHGRLLPSNNQKSLASDAVGSGMSSAERGRPPPASNLKSSASDTVGAGAISAERSRPLSVTNLKSSIPDTMGAGTSSAERSRRPHPDSQFLSQILAVPKMVEWSEFDDQEWLFNSKDLQSKPCFELEIDRTPQVWAEVLHIEAVDTHALPYVIPY